MPRMNLMVLVQGKEVLERSGIEVNLYTKPSPKYVILKVSPRLPRLHGNPIKVDIDLKRSRLALQVFTSITPDIGIYEGKMRRDNSLYHSPLNLQVPTAQVNGPGQFLPPH